ncbi:MAG: DUF2190 family protein [Candidatus Anstonellales archaeon]
MLQSPSFVAGGNISPGRVVLISGDFTVSQVTADAANANARKVVGIATTGFRRPQGFADYQYAAIAGEPIRVYGTGEVCLAEAGEDLVAGDRLAFNANGQVVKVTSVTGALVSVGIALAGANAGEYVRVYVNVNVIA